MNKKIICLIAMVLYVTGNQLHAQIILPKIFGNDMVLQRNKPLKIWGWCASGKTVLVHFNHQTAKALANNKGEWAITLKPMPAGGPYELDIASGKDTVSYKNILLGDVWICGGQSNMEFPVSGWGKTTNAEKEIADANHPTIRLFTVEKAMHFLPAKDLKGGQWQECTPANIPPFSAVAYFFGRKLNEELNVPIGLISSNWGGTQIQEWISWDSTQALTAYKNINPNDSASLKLPDNGPNSFPSQLYNAMIAPITPLTMKGVIWYQGEQNSNTLEDAKLYGRLFPMLIRDWRKKWKDDFPFFWAQLTSYHSSDNDIWPYTREAQHKALSLPNTGEAVITDIGEAHDVHPKNKQDVGYRLALAALNVAYHKTLVYAGPTFTSMKTEGNTIVLTFSNTGSGLMPKGNDTLKEFTIAGSDKNFVPAHAVIKGDTVIVSGDNIPHPVAVRYAWKDDALQANLFNKEGLPASSFRTDEW